MVLHLVARAIVLCSLFSFGSAFIPAAPTNDTSSFDGSRDMITVAYFGGVYAAPISRQLTAQAFDDDGNYTDIPAIVSWTRFSKGVLVHFDESSGGSQPPSLVPWLAMINCDTNGTTFSIDNDIFTLARDQGAQAALLYSMNSQGCLMNLQYLRDYEKVLDVYATTSLSASQIIENQFSNPGISADAYFYNSGLLNNSIASINQLLGSNALSVVGNVPTNLTNFSTVSTTPLPVITATLTSVIPTAILDTLTNSDVTASTATNVVNGTSAAAIPTKRIRRKRQQNPSATTSAIASAATSGINYLAAVMAAGNNTVGGLLTPSAAPTSNSSGNNNNSNTGLAMIILYAITGVVTLMFILVIVSGAIRAIRHPERYGPTARFADRDGNSRQQTRAGGLTRAILDTFPVVKFGRSGQEPISTADAESGQNGRSRDERGGNEARKSIEMEQLNSNTTAGTAAITPSVLPIPQNDSTLARRQSESNRSLAGENLDNASFVSAAEDLPPAIPAVTAEESTATADPALTVNPADVDDDVTCPICVCEFEEGEDVRILPCDGRHRFHQECIDPWLLQQSSLCPLCRLDLSGAAAAKAQQEEERRREEELEERENLQVRSNLRAMLQGRERRHTLRDSTAGSTTQNGSSLSSKFFRYAARKRAGVRQNREEEGVTRTPINALATSTSSERPS